MTRLPRLAAGLGVTTLLAASAALGPATPAHAEPGLPDLFVSFTTDPVAVINQEPSTLGMYVYNYGQAPATGVVVTIDAGAIADKVDITVPDFSEQCERTGDEVVCQVGMLAVNQVDLIHPITLAAKPGAPAGEAGGVTVTIAGAEEDSSPGDNTTTFPVTIVPSGPDLVALAADVGSASDRLGPGDQAPLLAALLNEGDQATPGFAFTFTFPTGATVAEQIPGCTYDSFETRTPPPGFVYGPHLVTCVVPLALEPGEGVTLFDPATGEALFDVVIGRNMRGPDEAFAAFEVRLADADEVSDATATVAGRALGSKMQRYKNLLAERGRAALEELDQSDNVADFAIWTKANTLDFAVTAPPVSGSVGGVVEVAYEIVNLGPSDGGGPGFEMTAPEGTVFLPSDRCFTTGTEGQKLPESTKLSCTGESEFLTVHTGAKLAGTVRIKIKSVPGDSGFIKVRNQGPATESNPANNTAPIVINTGGLANTGVRSGLVAAVGAAVLLTGVLLVVVARRRRVNTDAAART